MAANATLSCPCEAPDRPKLGFARLQKPLVDLGEARSSRYAAARRDDRRWMRFTDQDGAEETWPTMQSLPDAPPRVHPYAKVSWRSVAADKPVAGHGDWRGRWIN